MGCGVFIAIVPNKKVIEDNAQDYQPIKNRGLSCKSIAKAPKISNGVN